MQQQRYSLSKMEEWLKGVVIDPSFFLLKSRSDRLLRLLRGLEPREVIVPTDFYNMLRARHVAGESLEEIEKEDYYPRLLKVIEGWEIPITAERQREIFNWISSADFSALLSEFFRFKVVPAYEYLRNEPDIDLRHGLGFNPIDAKQTINLLGKTVGQIFYEMITVSEKTRIAILSATRGFTRLCRKIKIPTYEFYTEWKENFKKQHGFGGRFLIIFAAGAASGIAGFILGTLPAPVPHIAAFSVGVIVLDD